MKEKKQERGFVDKTNSSVRNHNVYQIVLIFINYFRAVQLKSEPLQTMQPN